ncbi:MAG: hypothetical protein WC389_21910, partial [Lutibacter sp.]
EKGPEIKELRHNATAEILAKKTYPIAFELDKNTYSTLQFKGYEGSYIDSKVTNGKRLFYDRTKPYVKPVKYFNNYLPSKEIQIPKAYILKQGWWKVLERLKSNAIEYHVLKNDTIITVEEQHIKDYKTSTRPFEGHYPHFNTVVSAEAKNVLFNKGDVYIPIQQNGVRYIIETLEAEATDSFFNWNFFDTVLEQKEHFSAYVFEDIAEKL